jgi:hypothetical protein
VLVTVDGYQTIVDPSEGTSKSDTPTPAVLYTADRMNGAHYHNITISFYDYGSLGGDYFELYAFARVSFMLASGVLKAHPSNLQSAGIKTPWPTIRIIILPFMVPLREPPRPQPSVSHLPLHPVRAKFTTPKQLFLSPRLRTISTSQLQLERQLGLPRHQHRPPKAC